MTKIITHNTNSKIASVGLDLAKNSFSVHTFDEASNTVLAKDLKRGQVRSFFQKLEPCRVGLEACASAHYWTRELIKLGHDVRITKYGDSAGLHPISETR
jgi:transposase